MPHDQQGARASVRPRPPEWDDPPGYDRKLSRMRTPSDDFYDHRLLVLEGIRHALAAAKRRSMR